MKLKELKLPRIDKHPSPHQDGFDVFFDKMDSDEIDFIGVDAKGHWFYVDPFVGCAFKYENKKDLVGKNAFVEGFWSLQKKNGMPVFIVHEDGLLIN